VEKHDWVVLPLAVRVCRGLRARAMPFVSMAAARHDPDLLVSCSGVRSQQLGLPVVVQARRRRSSGNLAESLELQGLLSPRVGSPSQTQKKLPSRNDGCSVGVP